MSIPNAIRCTIGAMLTLAACSERPTGPLTGAPIASLEVSGVRVTEVEFKASGRFELGLVATGTDGSAILHTNVGIAVTLDQPTGSGGLGSSRYTIARDQTTASVANTEVRAAILIDDSGSMSDSDPNLLRAAAARLFWETLLPASTGNQVALLDFGPGSTTGFRDTRLLQSWTGSAGSLVTALGVIGARGETPLYESVIETSKWISTTTTSDQKRMILLLTDGEPTGSATRLSAINAAKAAGVTIHGVGLGPASDKSTAATPAAVAAVREVAEQTGGVYAAATDAIALAPIFKILATVSSKGQLIGRFRISPVPPTGTNVRGTVSVTSGGLVETASFSFRAP